MKKKKAFTLSEILITMSIIGFVAAVTIPAMVMDYLRTQFITGAKSTFAQGNYILKKINADRECDNDLKCTGLFNAGTNSQTLGGEIVKYFKVVQNCGVSTNQNCWPANTNDNFNGTSGTNTNFNTSNYYYKFQGVDGKSYAIHNYTEDFVADCGNNGSTGALGGNSFMTQVCGVIIVDINGYRAPNTKGKDTFIYYITNGKGPLLYPSGGIDDNKSSINNMTMTNNYWNQGGRNFCNKATNQDGKYCTGRLMENSWEMDYF
jgi:prepilin-type N-terminal cleavage/methylation domain-containing protein